MIYVFDTNIVVHYLRESALMHTIDESFSPFMPANESWLSVVSLGEIHSIAMQSRWGAKRLAKLDLFLSKFLILDLNIGDLVRRYAEIDAFSQGKHPTIPSTFSARNMGKNDLWIAASASILNAALLTTDNDFNHLDKQFLKLERLKY